MRIWSRRGGRWWRRARMWALPVALLLALSLPSLRGGDWRVDTGRYAAVGLYSMREGSWWTLRAGEELYFNKPPLAIWIHGLVLWVFGPELWAARLPSALAAAGCVIATVGTARTMCGRRTAMVAGLILAGTLEFFRHTRQLSLDMWQAMLLMFAMWCVASAVRRGGAWKVVAAGVPLGLALLVKPMMALAAPVIFAAWLVMVGRARWIGWAGLSAVVAVAIAMAWHGPMIAMHGSAFTDQYFGRQALSRAVGEGFEAERWWWYARHFARTYWPWMITLGLALWTWARRGELSRDRRAAALAAVWAGVWIALLCAFADKRARYAMMVYPALAWLGAMWVARWSPRWVRSGRGRLWLDVLVLGAACVGAALVFTPYRGHGARDEEWAALNAFLAERGARGEVGEVERGVATGVWNGSLELAGLSRVYLAQGWWPRSTAMAEARGEEAAPGSLVIYDLRRKGARPEEGSVEVFRAERLVVVRNR